MTLEEYRVTLIERLRACPDTVAARALLAEAELMLCHSRLTDLTYDRFWETLEEHLDALADEAKFSSDRKAGAALDAIVAAARVRIARYRARKAGDAEAPGDS
jgi:hypothetical protein